MAVYAQPSYQVIIGTAAQMAGELAGATPGQKYFDETNGLWYVCNQDKSAWVRDVSAVSTGTTGGLTNNKGYTSALTITRPANTTAYSAGDVIGGALDLGVVGPSGKDIQVTGEQLEYDVTALPAGMANLTLYLYSVTPPSAIADNGVFDLPAGDRASYLGFIQLPTLVDIGSTLINEVNGFLKQVKLAGTHLFAYLVTVAGFTPAANSEVLVLTTHAQEA